MTPIRGAAKGRPVAARAGLEYVCLVCGSGMVERACRVRCPRCGYFEDCENGLTPPPVDRRSAILMADRSPNEVGPQILGSAILVADVIGRPEE